MTRRLKNAEITHVSYVDKGANKKKFFLTKELDTPTIEKEVKILIDKEEGNEQRLVYGIVYEPDVPDAHDDVMKAEDIEKSAHTFLSTYRNIDKQHDFSGGYGEVVESYVAPQDFEVGGEVIKKGSWVLVTKADEDVWEEIKKGEITGYSMAGTAEVEEIDEDDVQKSFFKLVKEFFTGEHLEKGELKDAYDGSRTRRNLFDALHMFEGFVADELYKSEPDEEKLKEYAQDVLDIFQQILSSGSLVKSLKEDFEKKEEIIVNKEDLKDILKEALAPVNERLENLEKEEEQEVEKGQEEAEVEKAEEKQAEFTDMLKSVIKEELAPINKRLEKVEQSRGVSKSLEEDVEKEEETESIYKDLFTFSQLQPHNTK